MILNILRHLTLDFITQSHPSPFAHSRVFRMKSFSSFLCGHIVLLLMTPGRGYKQLEDVDATSKNTIEARQGTGVSMAVKYSASGV